MFFALSQGYCNGGHLTQVFILTPVNNIVEA